MQISSKNLKRKNWGRETRASDSSIISLIQLKCNKLFSEVAIFSSRQTEIRHLQHITSLFSFYIYIYSFLSLYFGFPSLHIFLVCLCRKAFVGKGMETLQLEEEEKDRKNLTNWGETIRIFIYLNNNNSRFIFWLLE